MLSSTSKPGVGVRLALLGLIVGLGVGACTPSPRPTAGPGTIVAASSTPVLTRPAGATTASGSPTPTSTPTDTPFPTTVPATATALPTAVTPMVTVPPGGWDVTLTGTTFAELRDTTWVATALIGGPVLGMTRVTLAITAIGVGGHDACNSYGTEVQVTGATLHLNSPFRTMMFCTGPEGDIEAAYLNAFDQAREWWVSNAYLEFRDAGGRVLATFAKERNPVQTATPETPLPPPTNVVTPTIKSFTVSPTTAQRGQTLTLDWITTDALSVTVQHRDPNSWWGTEIPGNYPLSGNVVITDTAKDEGVTAFILTAYGAGGGWAQQEVTVKFPCLNAYFFTTQELSQCPLGPARTNRIVLQPFEHGWMVWIGYDTGGTVTVLYDGGRIATYSDTWTEAQPANDPTLTPPAYLLQPVRGFGLVWRTQPGVREGLGWATLAEGPYETQIQNRSTGGDWKAINYYFRLWDGRIVHVTGRTMPGQWEYISP